MLTLYREHLNHVKTVLVDGGYTGNNFSAAVHSNLKATVQVAKRNELHKFEVLPQRWLVERTFSWLDNVGAFGKIANDILVLVAKWLF